MTTASIPPLICSLALPTIATMLITSVYNMPDTYFVGKLGTSATAAVGISFSLMCVIQAIAAMSIVTRIMQFALSTLLGFINAPSLIRIFREDAKVIEIGTRALRFQCLTFPLSAWIVKNAF